jgi:hypothetical protein
VRRENHIEWRLGCAAKMRKAASRMTWRKRRSPACAPGPSATSCDNDAGVQMKVDAA